MPHHISAGLRTPVALFIFRRPEATEQVMAQVALARPSRLFLVADGPRTEREGEAQLCEAARAVAEKIDWPCEVIREYSDTNLGCKRRVSSGLDAVFAQTEEAIILEDDCVPHLSFFQYCDELLERYRSEPRVHMITGTNVLPSGAVDLASSYYFSRCHHTWGWASWARAWKHYDVEMQVWPQIRDTGWLDEYLPTESMARVASYIMDETYAGRVLTWDYQWALAGWASDALCVTPATNLVTNVGFEIGAAHPYDPSNPMANRPTAELSFPLRHPAQIEVDEALELESWARSYPDYFTTSDPHSVREAARRFARSLSSRFRPAGEGAG